MKDKPIYLAPLGFITGMISAALGIGGGLLLVPTLRGWFHYEQKDAVYISLIAIIPIASLGTVVHFIVDGDNIHFLEVLYLVIGSFAGSQAGVTIFYKLNEKILRYIFIVILLFSASKLMGLWAYLNLLTPESSLLAHWAIWFIITGFFAGVVSSMFGLGGGIIIVPALTQLFSYSIIEAITSSLLFIAPTAVFGYLFHRRKNQVEQKNIGILIFSALGGSVFGALLANHLPDRVLRFVFGLLLLYFVAKLLRPSVK